ncbi:MAG: hypothetical protein Q9227_008761 [Pyrenula ochraceoflavens]
MASTVDGQAYSVTPTQSRLDGRVRTEQGGSTEDHGTPEHASKTSRSFSGGSAQFGPRGSSLVPSVAAPGSFSTDLRSANLSRVGTPRPSFTIPRGSANDVGGEAAELAASERRQAAFRDQIAKEMRIKLGTENMLEALLAKSSKQTKEQRLKVESELSSSNRKLAELKSKLDEEINRASTPTTPPPSRSRGSAYFRASPLRSPRLQGVEEQGAPSEDFESESPTYVLSETLQALEMVGMQPDYYIERANSLVELFKRHPTLKYDLAWSVFGLRVQMMLLSDNPEIIAAGYRLTRYAIADRVSLKTIRALNTDVLVNLSLVKKGKAMLEREQALKFVRAFLDVKNGIEELSPAVLRTVIAVAEHHEDRLRNIALLTLTEVLLKDPSRLVAARGIATLSSILSEGTYPASESLVASFLHVLDVPRLRKHLKSGHEVQSVFAPFTDPFMLLEHEERLKDCIKALAVMFKSWPGLLAISTNHTMALRALFASLQYPSPAVRDMILELLFDVLRIKPPSWSSGFLAVRRLTTYGRVGSFIADVPAKRAKYDHDDNSEKFDLTAHFCSFLLVIMVEAGLIQALTDFTNSEEDFSLRRKAALLLTEVMKMSCQLLPATVSSHLQVLAELLPSSVSSPLELLQNPGLATIYQIESINRTLNRSHGATSTPGKFASKEDSYALALHNDQTNTKYPPTMDEMQFRAVILETQVLSSANYMKWKWDLILGLIEGPLTNPKRLEEVIKSSKFLKRIMGFFRPFKYRFSTIRNTKPNQRYVRVGCALMRTLVHDPEGARYLVESKVLRQIAECLAQIDRQSGITSTTPLFSKQSMSDTLSGGYFAMLGVLSQDNAGIVMLERWHMLNMFYHIIDLKGRPDLIQTFLGNMDFSLDSHLRVILSKALTAAPKEIRSFATKILRKHAIANDIRGANLSGAHWVLRLLVTQLYDPDVEVCGIAVKILEEACNRRSHLEYVVNCRPSLDHLGEIGAPLLLRFLSTSVGYHYLDGLDYITQEMDDWYLGRNDSYVNLIEASLSRAYSESSSRTTPSLEDGLDDDASGLVPPHFYRELARTEEGCKLLRQSGHFDDFANSIRDFDLVEEDTESLIRTKGCLWAVGNVGSMALGASFLEDTGVVRWIIRIAEGSEVMTMRGTACFVLGLISRSVLGLEMMREFGWDSPVNPQGDSLGYCVPKDMHKLLNIKSLGQLPETEMEQSAQQRYQSAISDAEPLNAKVLGLIVDLGNTVLARKTVNELNSIKQKRPDVFQQLHLFQKTLIVLECQHFRLGPRQFIFDLFDKNVLRRSVLEEDDDDSIPEKGA